MREGGRDRRQNEMDRVRERERKSQSLPQPVSLFITIMSVLLSPYPPTKISYSQGVCSYGVLAEWRVGLSTHFGRNGAGRRSVHLVDPVQDGGKGKGCQVEDSQWQCRGFEDSVCTWLTLQCELLGKRGTHTELRLSSRCVSDVSARVSGLKWSE